MSAAVREALETAVAELGWEDRTAWENLAFTPVEGEPYQRVNFVFAAPANTEISAAYMEQGFLQLMLCYPADTGWAEAAARADEIRAAFPRGRSLPPVGGVTTTIELTPEIMPAVFDQGRYCTPVRVRFFAPVSA